VPGRLGGGPQRRVLLDLPAGRPTGLPGPAHQGGARLTGLDVRHRAIPPAWAQQMAARHRKILVVCHPCHEHVHYSESATPRKQRTT
jgi:hypothetical protein